MNFFEQELRRLVKTSKEIRNPVFAGRACYVDLGGDNRAKLEFVTTGHADHYAAIKATVLNRHEGVVDTLLFRFKDIWGKKYDHGYNDGVPHIWTDQGKSEWYVYQPTDADIRQLAAEVGGYLGVFTDHSRAPEKAHGTAEKDSIVEKIRSANQTPAISKAKSGKKKMEREH